MLCKDHRLKLSAALLGFICEEHFRVLMLRTALKSIGLSTVSVFGIFEEARILTLCRGEHKMVQPSRKAIWHNLPVIIVCTLPCRSSTSRDLS